MGTLKINENELKSMLNEVAEDLSKLFEDAAPSLTKSELRKDDAPPKEESSGESDGPPAEGSESGSAPGASAAAAPDASSAAPESAPSPDGVDPAADQSAALTPEALQAEYMKLDPASLDMHIKAALAAKAAQAGAPDAGGLPPPDASASAGAPPAGPGAGAPPPGAAPMAMAEIQASPERNGKGSIDSVAKSEIKNILTNFEDLRKKENEAKDAKIAELESKLASQAEDIDNLARIAKSMLEQPLRKAVTSVAHLPKAPEPRKELTKETIHAHLRELSSKPDLKKSDRQLILDFYDGRVTVDKLAPLFEGFVK